MPASKAVQAKLKQKFGKKGSQRTGGKGSARRRKRQVRKSNNTEDKRLQTQLKKLNVNSIPAIEEVNLFKEDAKVIHFQNPRVQASIAANTYVVSGKAEEKDLGELLPSILPQLGPSALEDLKHLQHEMQQNVDLDEDDDIPDLVEATNFEEIVKKEGPPQEEEVPSQPEAQEIEEIS